MESLSHIFDKTRDSIQSDDKYHLNVIKLWLARTDIVISDETAVAILGHIRAGQDAFSFVDSSKKSRNSSELRQADLDAVFLESDNLIEKSFEEALNNLLESEIPDRISEIKGNSKRVARIWKRKTRRFEKKVESTWARGLRELLIQISVSRDINDRYTLPLQQTDVTPTTPQLHKALGIPHTRACRTAMEIYTLLKCGYIDGANARWRALHETSVILMFLAENGNDVAKRYLDHAEIQQHREMTSHQKHHAKLGEDPIDAQDVDELDQIKIDLQNHYSENLKGDYWWAAKCLGVKRPTFTQIEESLELDHWRPYYKLACRSVHAGPMKSIADIWLRPSETTFSGPIAGDLDLPGRNCALTLGMASTTFVTTPETAEGIIMANVILELSHETCEAFEETVSSLMDDDRDR